MGKKYVLVVGGELMNKGAQAMTYITADAMAKKYPDCEVVVFSAQDAKRPEKEKEKYTFKLLPFPLPNSLDPCGKLLIMAKNLMKRKPLSEGTALIQTHKEIFKNAVAMLDISGYALSSDFSVPSVKGYLRRIKLAKKYNVPVYIMPQSFGPFDFKQDAEALKKDIAKTLSYAKCIMAREQEGKDFLEKELKLTNVVKTPDLVLQNKGIDLNNVFHILPEISDAGIENGSVALIPNSKNNKFGDASDVFVLYHEICEQLLANGKKVYFIYHSAEDLTVCNQFKAEFYAENADVTVIERELSCLDFDKAVQKFDFVVASRYHSVVHAYKEAVPAVILGWAVKYRELADMFGQKDFCFNVKDSLNHESILDAVSHMLEHAKEESDKIAAGLKEAQKENVYGLI